MVWKIARIGNDPVVSFAVDELKKYLSMMDPACEYAILNYKKYNPAYKGLLWVGIAEEFEVPSVDDPEKDDAIVINVSTGDISYTSDISSVPGTTGTTSTTAITGTTGTTGTTAKTSTPVIQNISGAVAVSGYITGSNSRSILIAVYRFLRELGCAWIRPGKDGEVIPERSLASGVFVKVSEVASYRHRSVCIEGAVSYDHVVNMIDWMPKVGMNGYFNQFRIPFTFYDRWYRHLDNPLYEEEPLTNQDVEGIRDQTVFELKRRGMLYHACGHGWTCEPFGIEGTGWDAKGYDVPEETKPLIALVDGKRELFRGIPLNTNMCYSDERVIKIISDAVADYCIEYPDVDYLHVWLGDSMNSHCECERCGDTRPADLYINLLNNIDANLTAKGIPTKIVFLIYLDLLWEPIETRFNNPDRFVLMFAPISRTYSNPIDNTNPFDPDKLAPFTKNKLKKPTSVEENLAFLKKWQDVFDGDSFDFDYHFMWDHFKDPGYYAMAQILFTDMKNLKELGIGGMVSCQNQRVFFPNGLGMIAMAAALWNRDEDFDSMADRYFKDAYGEDGAVVKEYLVELSSLFDPPYIRNEKQIVNEESAAKFAKIPNVISEFKKVIDKNLCINAPLLHAQRKSWVYLYYHAELCKILARAFEYRARGEHKKAETVWSDAASYARLYEKELADVFDVFEFQRTIGRIIRS